MGPCRISLLTISQPDVASFIQTDYPDPSANYLSVEPFFFPTCMLVFYPEGYCVNQYQKPCSNQKKMTTPDFPWPTRLVVLSEREIKDVKNMTMKTENAY